MKDQEHAELLFNDLDTSRDDTLGLDEFMNICEVSKHSLDSLFFWRVLLLDFTL